MNRRTNVSDMTTGITPAELARELGRSPKQVRELLRLTYGKLVRPVTRWELSPQQVEAVRHRLRSR